MSANSLLLTLLTNLIIVDRVYIFKMLNKGVRLIEELCLTLFTTIYTLIYKSLIAVVIRIKIV
jgi:hypothetical protein